MFETSGFQKALLLSRVLQRAHTRETKIRRGGVEHSVRVDELGSEGCHDAGTMIFQNRRCVVCKVVFLCALPRLKTAVCRGPDGQRSWVGSDV